MGEEEKKIHNGQQQHCHINQPKLLFLLLLLFSTETSLHMRVTATLSVLVDFAAWLACCPLCLSLSGLFVWIFFVFFVLVVWFGWLLLLFFFFSCYLANSLISPICKK